MPKLWGLSNEFGECGAVTEQELFHSIHRSGGIRMVHITNCRKCGDPCEVEGDETICNDCLTAMKCGFHNKNELENETINYLMEKYVFNP